MKISQTVFELHSGHDFVTDRQTDGWMDGWMDGQTDRRPGQKQYVSQPYGGRHNDTDLLPKMLSC